MKLLMSMNALILFSVFLWLKNKYNATRKSVCLVFYLLEISTTQIFPETS